LRLAARQRTHAVVAPTAERRGIVSAPSLGIPEAVASEHEEIHRALVAATEAPGPVGAAARQLAEVLHPHFVREEQIALPPLGLLAPLAAGTPLPDEVATAALAMTESLRMELPQMLREHAAIRSAIEKLRAAAVAERAASHEELAARLALHARTEEEVLYPAAVLVGDVIRARSHRTR
jgi:hypothetical protein